MNRGAWRATVHRVAKSWTRLSELAYMHMVIQRQRYGLLPNTQKVLNM